jgi:hypothetical protein
MSLFRTQKVSMILIAIVISFAIGRYTNRAKISSSIIDTKTNKSDNTHIKTVIVETKQPSGEDRIVTTTNTDITDNVVSLNDTSTQTQPVSKIINISILGANDFSRGIIAPTWGISAHKEIYGPITLGAFALMSGTIGISVGVDF